MDNNIEREFPQSPLVGVGAVVVQDARVLLVRRGTEPLKGRWTLPGGLLEVGEALTAGVIREVREETGLDVEPIELIELSTGFTTKATACAITMSSRITFAESPEAS